MTNQPYVPVIEKYPVRVYDESFDLVAEIDDYISLTWTRRWRTAGEFELQVNRYSTGADELQAGRWASIYRAGVARIARIESMELPLDENGQNSEVWTIKGTDGKGIFQQRISMVGADSGTGYDTQPVYQMAEHAAADAADPQYILLDNSTAYRYYAIKFADNWGHASLMGVRRIELQSGTGSFTSQYPPAQNGTYVIATTSLTGFDPFNATDPGKSLTGDWAGNSWMANNVATDQRFHIDFGSAKTITRIYYENQHLTGAACETGVKNFTVWGSNDAAAFAELTYDTDDGWTQIPMIGLPCEGVMRHYIDGNIVSATDTNRRIAEFQMESIHSPGLGGLVSYSARLESISQILDDLCLASPDQIGYDVAFIRATKKLEFRVLAGTDRSASIIFSTLIGNVGTMNYLYDLTSVKNLAYVGDSGDLAARIFTEVYDDTEPSGFDRREVFVDASDATTPAEVTQAGVASLNENSIAESADFTVMKDNSVQYSTRDAAGDYDIGDIITVVYGGIMTMSARIVEITEGYGTMGAYDDIKITVGTTANDIVRFLKQQDKKNSVRRRA